MMVRIIFLEETQIMIHKESQTLDFFAQIKTS